MIPFFVNISQDEFEAEYQNKTFQELTELLDQTQVAEKLKRVMKPGLYEELYSRCMQALQLRRTQYYIEETARITHKQLDELLNGQLARYFKERQ